ncbi:increased petal growth anisotropy 1-like protein [Drosera capensis]
MMVKKQPMGHHHKPPKTPPQPSPPSSGNKATTSAFTRSFGVYFPRASAQVQPRPPDLTTVSDLFRLVEELRDREYRLKTELLEHKLLRESVAIVPLLESQIASKAGELQSVGKRIEKLVAENECLLHENELLNGKLEEERRERERKVGDLEAEVVNLRHKLRMKEIEAEERLSSCSKTTLSSSDLCRNLSSTRKIVAAARAIEVSVSVSSNGSSSSNNNVDHFMKGAAMDVVESKRAEQRGESESRPRDSCSASCSEELPETSEFAISAVRSRAPRVPKPPPMKRSNSSSSITASDRKSADCATIVPPPPPPPFSFKAAAPPPPPPRRPVRSPEKAAGSQPPPPPPLPAKGMMAMQQPKVKRVPEVVEFYHSLMRRDTRRESGAGVAELTAANTRDLVGEIENRSAHLLAIKTDVETQGDLIRFLIKEIGNALFTEIEDVVAFVKWLDDELSYLVDERAVLKHFDWPELKADALREAAFEYSDLKKLEYEASTFKDNTRQACAPALKKMQALLEKLEHGAYNLSRLRESAANRFKALLIPVDWMLENGVVSQIKLASVKLAMKYMKRVSAELDSICGGPEEEELIVQGVRFAFRVHQFAGGFDIETMRAFQELRDRANSCRSQCQNQQQQQKLVCRFTAC